MLKIILLLLVTFVASEYVCNQQAAGGCEGFDRAYREGEKLHYGCWALECNNGFNGLAWQDILVDDCKTCLIPEDVLYLTFDSNRFTMNTSCNYTVVQPINCTEGNATYNPSFAIYTDFERCYNENSQENISCPITTTYKMDEFTVFTIKHSNLELSVNGAATTVNSNPRILCDSKSKSYPVFAWITPDNCLFFLGSTFLIRACPSKLFIKTKDTTKDRIAGLCGFYSGVNEDDFLTRDCQRTNEVQESIPTWRTANQTKTECIDKVIDEPKMEDCTNAVNDYVNDNYDLIQRLLINIQALIEQCLIVCLRVESSCILSVVDSIPNIFLLK